MPGNDHPGSGEDRLYRDPQLADFYDLENHWGHDDDYCQKLAANASSVLDLGCGTGRLATALATNGCAVVGVDPATAMLNVARSKPSGNLVSWIEGDAREVRLGRRFDLVLLTGHAFQVFLSSADQRAVLNTIAELLPQVAASYLTLAIPKWRNGGSGVARNHNASCTILSTAKWKCGILPSMIRLRVTLSTRPTTLSPLPGSCFPQNPAFTLRHSRNSQP